MVNLIRRLPPLFREYEENKQIMTVAEDPEFNHAWQIADNILDDAFVMDATENGVKRYEKELGIVPKATSTLHERKFIILSKYQESLPFTMRKLNMQLEVLCGAGNYYINLVNDDYLLKIRIALVSQNNLPDVRKMLESILPANMVLDLDLSYNTHGDLADLTHADLAPYTHQEIGIHVFS